ncbi:hypothetical protein [Ilyonectria pseudodestructans chrysovirus 1]|nr:hypothetical protein [Ilyonectria pseudodestructans chrysovirus 1]
MADSVFKTVFDLMGNASKGKMFRGKSVENDSLDALEQYDGELAEYNSLALVELNILSGVSMPDNFTLEKDGEVINVGITAVAHGSSGGRGKSELCHTKEVELKPFETYGEWRLEYEHGKIGYSEHKGLKTHRDKSLMAQISAQCTNLSERESSGLAKTLVGEVLSQPADMRHVFMKGYLMLMDLNLSVVFRRETRRYRNTVNHYFDNLTGNQKLGMIAAKQIVVDAEGFSGDELYTLSIMCQQYPVMKFCEDNIYNTCHMAADDLAILSDRMADRSDRVVQSPMEFYRNMVSVACKLRCMEDMESAFKMMRGRMSHIRDVNKLSGDRLYHSGVPKSVSYFRCLGGSTRHAVTCTSYPSYLATSVSLVADLLLGSCYEVAASLLVEYLGGLGNLLCPEPPAYDRGYNSLVRDNGLSSKDAGLNELMQAWTGLGAGWYRWSPQMTWKPYFIRLTEELRNNEEVLIPQMCFEIAHMYNYDNVWGALRGYRGIEGAGLSSMADVGKGATRRKDEKLRLTAAFTWAMGVRKNRPRMFTNAYGKKEVSVTTREREFLRGCTGEYRLSTIGYTLSDEYLGREDWIENAGSSIIRATIAGTRCSMIMSTAGKWSYAEFREDSEERELPAGISESVNQRKTQQDFDDAENLAKMVHKDIQDKPLKDDVHDIFGKLKGVLHGEHVKLTGVELPSNKDKEVATFRRIPTPRDGQNKCGIHAVVASMKEMGMLKTGEENLAFDNFDGKMREETFHDAASLAGGLVGMGIGLRVYDRVGDGVRTIEYGDVEGPAISIYREGIHFEGAVDGEGDTMPIVGREGGHYTNQQQLEALKEMRQFFEGH